MKPIYNKNTLYALLLLILCLTGCHKDVAPEWPNDRGDKILDATLPSNFARLLNWSPDGRELFYLAQPPGAVYQIRALNVQTKTTRLIAQDNRWQFVDPVGSVISTSNDGQYTCLLAGRGPYAVAQPYYLYRVSMQQAGQVAVLDSAAYKPGEIYSLRVSNTGNQLAFRASYDSVRVYSLATRTAVSLVVSRFSPIVFSPDGNRLLGYSKDKNVYQILSFPDLTTTDLMLPPPTSTLQMPYPSAFRQASDDISVWNDNGIQYAYSATVSGSSTTNLWNATQQKSTLVYTQAKDEFPVDNTSVVWSRDGQRVAFTTSNSTQLFSGHNTNEIIYSTDLNSLKMTKVATISRASDEYSIYIHSYIISPDKSRLAYVINGSVYIASIQP